MQFISEDIQSRLLEKIGKNKKVVQVPIIVESFSKKLECFFNVNKKIQKSGGNVCYGWIIHENTFFYEAERHAIWQNKKKELIDITPNESKENYIYFVLDNDFIYNNRFTPNIRINLTINEVVEDYIFVLDTIDYLYTFGEQQNNSQLVIAEPIIKTIYDLQEIANYYYSLLMYGFEHKDFCFCSSNITYKKCHKLTFRKHIDNLINKLKKIGVLIKN